MSPTISRKRKLRYISAIAIEFRSILGFGFFSISQLTAYIRISYKYKGGNFEHSTYAYANTSYNKDPPDLSPFLWVLYTIWANVQFTYSQEFAKSLQFCYRMKKAKFFS